MLCLLFGFSPANQATSLDFSNWLVVLRIERGLQSMSFFALHRHSPSACVISSSMRRANQWTPDTRDRLSRHTCRPGAPRRNHGRAPGLGRRSGSGHGHGRNRLSRGLLGQAAQVAYSTVQRRPRTGVRTHTTPRAFPSRLVSFSPESDVLCRWPPHRTTSGQRHAARDAKAAGTSLKRSRDAVPGAAGGNVESI